MNKLITSYAISALLVIALMCAAREVSKYLVKHRSNLLNSKNSIIAKVLGAALLFVAGITKLGIQTWGGDSAPEILHDWLFIFLSSAGTFIVFLEIFISHEKSKST